MCYECTCQGHTYEGPVVDCLITSVDIGEMTSAELRQLRDELGLTQQQLADTLGISLSRLGDYERGRLRGGRRGSAAIPRAIELACEALRARYARGSRRNNHDPVPR
jgi:DNA-binding XRE family transcriptional regulator